MGKNYKLSVKVADCTKIQEASSYNWNVYQLPFSIDDRNILICQGDDDRTEYYWLITEEMLKNKNYSEKLPMWCRDIEDDQSVFKFYSENFGVFPS